MGGVQSKQLAEQVAALSNLASQNGISLIPPSFRKGAELRLMLAQARSPSLASQDRIAEQFLSQFETTRKAAVERMMEDASKQVATKDEIVKLVHTLDGYAKACQDDLEKQSSRSDSLQASLGQLQSDTTSSIQGLRADIAAHASKTSDLESGMGKLSGSLESSARSLRLWLIVLSACVVAEGASLIYLFARM